MSKTLYNLKTSYPVQEIEKSGRVTSTKKTVTDENLEAAEIVELYNGYLKSDYKVSVSFKQPETPSGDQTIDSPFDVAENLTKQGIDYKATLKLKTKGAYDDLKPAMKLIEAEGFDMQVGVTLKINDKTSINIDDPDTYQDADAVYKVTPKAASKDINDLRGLYEDLDKRGFEVEIDIKPKMPKEDDESIVDAGGAFKTQLEAYPSGTLVQFNLTNA